MYNVNSPTVQGMLSSTPRSTGNLSEYQYTPGMNGNLYVESFYATPQQMEQQRVSTQPLQTMEYYTYGNDNTPCDVRMFYPTLNGMMEDKWRYNPYATQSANQYYQSIYNQRPNVPSPNYNQYYGQIQQQPPTYYSNPNPMYGYGNPIFNGYYNPYMGQNNQPIIRQQVSRKYANIPVRMDAIMEQAQKNGVSFEEQLETESRFWKSLSRCASAGLGRSKEETKLRESIYDIKDIDEEALKTREQRMREYEDEKFIPPLIITVKRGDEVIFTNVDKRPRCVNYNHFNDQIAHVERLRDLQQKDYINRTLRNNYLYEHAVEREIEKSGCSLMEFFNEQAWKLNYDMYQKMRNMQRTNAGRLFNKNRFMMRLEQDKFKFDQYHQRDQDYMTRLIRRTNEERKLKEGDKPLISADGKYIRGNNGVLPNGKRVTGDMTPEMAKAVSESFIYNTETNTVTIVPPDWISRRKYEDDKEEQLMKILEDKFIDKASRGNSKQNE